MNGAGDCVVCSAALNGDAHCDVCPAGYVLRDGDCAVCTRAANGDAACSSCPTHDGYILNVASGDCVVCRAALLGSACTACPKGHHLTAWNEAARDRCSLANQCEWRDRTWLIRTLALSPVSTCPSMLAPMCLCSAMAAVHRTPAFAPMERHKPTHSATSTARRCVPVVSLATRSALQAPPAPRTHALATTACRLRTQSARVRARRNAHPATVASSSMLLMDRAALAPER